MHIGVPKETKNHEYRVGLTPASVRELVQAGHGVTVQTGAGAGVRSRNCQNASGHSFLLNIAQSCATTVIP